MTLYEQVRAAIGPSGPQLPEPAYSDYINNRLSKMTCDELLQHISNALDADRIEWAIAPIDASTLDEPPGKIITHAPIGGIAQALGITGYSIHPDNTGTVQAIDRYTQKTVTFDAPLHVIMWLRGGKVTR